MPKVACWHTKLHRGRIAPPIELADPVSSSLDSKEEEAKPHFTDWDLRWDPVTIKKIRFSDCFGRRTRRSFAFHIDTPLSVMKQFYADWRGLPVASLRFMISDIFPAGSQTLRSLGMMNGDNIDVFCTSDKLADPSAIHLRFKDTNGGQENVMVYMHTTMFWAKQIYADRIRVPLSSLRFRFDDAPVPNDSTPSSLSMSEDDVIEVFQEQSGADQFFVRIFRRSDKIDRSILLFSCRHQPTTLETFAPSRFALDTAVFVHQPCFLVETSRQSSGMCIPPTGYPIGFAILTDMSRFPNRQLLSTNCSKLDKKHSVTYQTANDSGRLFVNCLLLGKPSTDPPDDSFFWRTTCHHFPQTH
ncbi:hypothetical protein BV898_00952 [Hypsibius exemplaris]|uniref:Ubiquitin-like domain-containing protein n=1 Tax=Hypsibius exemplaris TaxID=2072580 RepID=A0A1W0XCY8_HYPEX|nr:hypothetical protein BV898_00952 [Hypsibius exemplaris]